MPDRLSYPELLDVRQHPARNVYLYDATAEDLATFDQMMADAGKKEDMARRFESVEHAQARLASPDVFSDVQPASPSKPRTVKVRSGHNPYDGTPRYVEIPSGRRGTEDYHEAYMAYLKGKTTSEQMAALQSDDAEQAGYLLMSEQLASGILKEVDDLLFIRRYARIHTVPSADSLGIRKRTARMNTWGWTTELDLSAEDTSLKYGKKVLTPHPATGLIKISQDLLRRSTDVDGEVRGEIARDAGELLEDGYLTGNGAQQPLGVFTASSDGISTSRDVDTGSTTSITADALITAKYTLKSQYRNGGARQGCRWLFHRDALAIIAKLKDADNHYLFRPGQGLRGDDPDFLLGFPVDESERVPNTFTAALYVGLLCNWRYYEIADALDMSIQVLNELYAATNQVGMIGRLKTDGMPTLEEAFVRLKTDAS